MKNVKIYLAALLMAGSSLVFNSCDKEEMSATPTLSSNGNGNNGMNDDMHARSAQALAGNILFKVITPEDKPIADVKIHVGKRRMDAPQYSYPDYDLQTNQEGFAYVRNLMPGTYFFTASKQNYPTTLTRTGYATVVSGQTSRVILSFDY